LNGSRSKIDFTRWQKIVDVKDNGGDDEAEHGFFLFLCMKVQHTVIKKMCCDVLCRVEMFPVVVVGTD
jgi:hypothetical protein